MVTMYRLVQTHAYDGRGIRRLPAPRETTYPDTMTLDKALKRLRRRGLTGKGGRHYRIYLEETTS